MLLAAAAGGLGGFVVYSRTIDCLAHYIIRWKFANLERKIRKSTLEASAEYRHGKVVLRWRQRGDYLLKTASLQPSGLSSLLAAIRCSLATERASHVAGRSSDRPAKLPGAVRHR